MGNDESSEVRAQMLDMINDLSNRILLLNQQMERMEHDGQDETEGYENLSAMEWALCDARRKIRGQLRRS